MTHKRELGCRLTLPRFIFITTTSWLTCFRENTPDEKKLDRRSLTLINPHFLPYKKENLICTYAVNVWIRCRSWLSTSCGDSIKITTQVVNRPLIIKTYSYSSRCHHRVIRHTDQPNWRINKVTDGNISQQGSSFHLLHAPIRSSTIVINNNDNCCQLRILISPVGTSSLQTSRPPGPRLQVTQKWFRINHYFVYAYGSTPNQFFVSHILEKTELLDDINLYGSSIMIKKKVYFSRSTIYYCCCIDVPSWPTRSLSVTESII